MEEDRKRGREERDRQTHRHTHTQNLKQANTQKSWDMSFKKGKEL